MEKVLNKWQCGLREEIGLEGSGWEDVGERVGRCLGNTRKTISRRVSGRSGKVQHPDRCVRQLLEIRFIGGGVIAYAGTNTEECLSEKASLEIWDAV